MPNARLRIGIRDPQTLDEAADALEAQDKLIEQMRNSLVWAVDWTDIKAPEFYRDGDACTCPVCEALAAYERYKEKA